MHHLQNEADLVMWIFIEDVMEHDRHQLSERDLTFNTICVEKEKKMLTMLD